MRGYEHKADGSIILYITDSYQTKKNHGQFTISLAKMYKYGSNGGGYLILKKA